MSAPAQNLLLSALRCAAPDPLALEFLSESEFLVELSDDLCANDCPLPCYPNLPYPTPARVPRARMGGLFRHSLSGGGGEAGIFFPGTDFESSPCRSGPCRLDYEKDIRRNSFNFYRCLIALHGARWGPLS